MRESWVGLWLLAALAGGWRLGFSPAMAGLLASGASAVALTIWQVAAQARRRRAARPGDGGREEGVRPRGA